MMLTPLLVPLVSAGAWAFWICVPLMVLGALGMVLSRKAVHSALCLAAVMVGLAVQYASMDAPFLFVAQIIVYTGAIMMLFLFVVMLIGVDMADSVVETIKGQRGAAILAGLGLFVLLVLAVGRSVVGPPAGVGQANAANGGNIHAIAALIFGRYVFAFEVTAALLITAAVGAMVLSHPERVRPLKRQKELASDRLRAYATRGEHPGPLPSSGVYARTNAIHAPALLPDGTVAESSVSRTLQLRGAHEDPETLGAATARNYGEIEAAQGSDEA